MSGSFQNIVIYNGHSKPVSRAVCGTTTELIYSCSRDTTVRQWNRSGGDSLQVFAGHTLACSAVALSAGTAGVTGRGGSFGLDQRITKHSHLGEQAPALQQEHPYETDGVEFAR